MSADYVCQILSLGACFKKNFTSLMLVCAYSIKIGVIFRVRFERRKVDKQINKKLSCRWDSRPYCLTAPLGSRDVIGHVTI